MNQLKVISHNGQLVTESREVAKMTDKRHADLIRDIENYKAVLDQNAKLRSDDFFIETSYQAGTGRNYKCFMLTRKGCDMVANKMTGEKGVLFTAEYVCRFEEMEQQLQQQPRILTDKERLKASMKLSLEHDEKIEKHDERITYLEDHMRIDGLQEKRLQDKGKSVVIESLGGMKSNAYQEISRKAFAAIWRDFKKHFDIPRYNELPRKQYEDGIRFLSMWQPSTSLRIEIEELNRQIQGVI